MGKVVVFVIVPVLKDVWAVPLVRPVIPAATGIAQLYVVFDGIELVPVKLAELNVTVPVPHDAEGV